MGLFTVGGTGPILYLSQKTMRLSILSFALLFAVTGNVSAQTDPWLSFTIDVGVCHGAKPMKIQVIGRESVLKKFMRKESVHFDNCNYLLESADGILKSAKPAEPPPGTPEDDSPIWVKDPGEFLELYNIEKRPSYRGKYA
jgi:hypothetical protein